MDWVPNVGSSVEVQFHINKNLLWWPAQVCTTSFHGSEKRGTNKVTGTLLYDAKIINSVEYKQEIGRVLFKDKSILFVLDANSNKETEASWRTVRNNSGENNSNHLASFITTGSTTPTLTPAENPQNSLKNSTNTTQFILPSGSNHSLVTYDVGRLIGRLDYMERQVTLLHSQQCFAVTQHYLTSFKYSLRRKLLEYMQRPIQTYRPRQKTAFSNCFQDHLINLSVDCDYKMFIDIFKDITDKSDFNSNIHIYPSSFKDNQPSFSTGPIHIIFATFRDLANWIGVKDDDDLTKLLYKKSRLKHLSAATLLASTVFEKKENDNAIHVFLGSSADAISSDESCGRGHSPVSAGYTLRSEEWDAVNDRFKNNFTKSQYQPRVTQNQDISSTTHYFQLVWRGLTTSARSTWSLDSTHTGAIILGTLGLHLPSVELQGRHMLHQLGVNSLVSAEDDPHQ